MDEARRPQFGTPDPSGPSRDRPAAFGLALRDGRLACVRIEKPEGVFIDLPGGGVDPGETPDQAMVRELGEETGLLVRASGPPVAHAGQFIRMWDGSPANSLSDFFVAEIVGENPALKVEDDHTLIWLSPDEALQLLRHDAHAWAVAAWLRRRG